LMPSTSLVVTSNTLDFAKNEHEQKTSRITAIANKRAVILANLLFMASSVLFCNYPNNTYRHVLRQGKYNVNNEEIPLF
jgi:hypothetical protein